MKLREYIDPSWILVGLRPADKLDLLSTLAAAAAERLGTIDAVELGRRLLEREQQSSTGMGNGVAVPHTFIDGLERMACFLAQIPDGVGYEATDDQPVYFVVLLIGPAGGVGNHLKLLARTARLVRRPEFVREIAAVSTADEVFQLVLAEDERHAEGNR
jgi:mannitol/fructose-specific phosphotransferase system IIA component (Ntr-type)